MSKQEILERVEKVAGDQDQMEGMEVLEDVLEGLIVYGERINEASEFLEAKRKKLTETKKTISMARQARQARQS